VGKKGGVGGGCVAGERSEAISTCLYDRLGGKKNEKIKKHTKNTKREKKKKKKKNKRSLEFIF